MEGGKPAPLSRDGRFDDGDLVGRKTVEVVDERVDLAIGLLDMHLDQPAGEICAKIVLLLLSCGQPLSENDYSVHEPLGLVH